MTVFLLSFNLTQWGLAGDYLANQGYSADSDNVISARRNCLNAQLETLGEKKTFQDHVNKRCIIPMQAMYEWQWGEPGNEKSKKTKYMVSKPDNSVFSCAGIYNSWKDPKTKLITFCYTICTTEGNTLMKQIKNEGERMLVVLNEDEQDQWLNPEVPYMAFWDRSHIELKAELAPHIPVTRKKPATKNNLGIQTSLF